MKAAIHPTLHTATVTCSCGKTFDTLSTKEAISTEVCSNCHPFFTGKHAVVDTERRVEKFEEKRKRAEKKAQTQTHRSKREKRAARGQKRASKHTKADAKAALKDAKAALADL